MFSILVLMVVGLVHMVPEDEDKQKNRLPARVVLDIANDYACNTDAHDDDLDGALYKDAGCRNDLASSESDIASRHKDGLENTDGRNHENEKDNHKFDSNNDYDAGDYNENYLMTVTLMMIMMTETVMMTIMMTGTVMMIVTTRMTMKKWKDNSSIPLLKWK